eukprot:TRINITY_DN5833_c0_g1_i3.p1 TRINITY_DN5833_c0_g1~~TRINITY_DN5833_c0_g1_i3.p1  ORF type:complete len:475 (+),score=63.46 TRINITY_DN5833_c0_g1_i3:292-1716(+)
MLDFIPKYEVTDSGDNTIQFNFKKSHPYPKELSVPKGCLKNINGYNFIHLKGSYEDIGRAHGRLAKQQIMDFFIHYFIETIAPVDVYLEKVVPYMKESFVLSKQFEEESKAIIEGMKESDGNMYLEELQRDFEWIDIVAINSYYEIAVYLMKLDMSSGSKCVFKQAEVKACTQFGIWGSQSSSSETILGRNMDGELDVRKVTVTHLTVFLIDRISEDKKSNKIVSVMWPGFVGTYSGFNETGIYVMKNAAICSNKEQIKGYIASDVMRRMLEHFNPDNFSPNNVESFLVGDYAAKNAGSNQKNKGFSLGGSILFCGGPNIGNNVPVFVYEGDGYGGTIRCPGDAATPEARQCILASNHFEKYGLNPFKRGYHFEEKVEDLLPAPAVECSLRRYHAGENCLDAWARTGKKGTETEIFQLLQRACHATTEHSIVWVPHTKKFFLSNASSTGGLWDAPYEEFTEFGLSDLFQLFNTN